LAGGEPHQAHRPDYSGSVQGNKGNRRTIIGAAVMVIGEQVAKHPGHVLSFRERTMHELNQGLVRSAGGGYQQFSAA